MSALKLIIPTGATSAIGSAVVFGSGPLQWLAVGVVVVAVAVAVFVVVVRVVGNDRWSSNAADVLELVVIRQPRQRHPERRRSHGSSEGGDSLESPAGQAQASG